MVTPIDPGVWLPWAISLAAVAVMVAVVWGVVRFLSARGWAAGGVYVRVTAPVEVDPAGAVGLWRHVASMARPAWKAFLFGQPPVAFEYAFSGAELDMRIWVSRAMNADMVAHGVKAAWPGAATTMAEADDPIPAGAQVAGGRVDFSDAEAPVLTDSKVDGLRAMLEAASSRSTRDTALVQIIAQPARAGRVRRLRRAAGAASPSMAVTAASMVLDIVTPGPSTTSSSHKAPPHVASSQRVMAERAKGVMVLVAVRYTVTSTQAGVSGAELRGRADALAAAVVSAIGVPGTRRKRLVRTHHIINGRRMS